MHWVNFGSRYVVNAVFAPFNQVLDFVEPGLAGIAEILSTGGLEAQVVYCEYDRMEKRLVWIIKRAVYEDIPVVILRGEEFWHEVGRPSSDRTLSLFR